MGRKSGKRLSRQAIVEAQVALDRRLGKVMAAIPEGPARQKLVSEAARKRGEAGLSEASKRLLADAEHRLASAMTHDDRG